MNPNPNSANSILVRALNCTAPARMTTWVVAVLLIGVVAGCGGGGGSNSESAVHSPVPGAKVSDPLEAGDPDQYFPLAAGNRWSYHATYPTSGIEPVTHFSKVASASRSDISQTAEMVEYALPDSAGIWHYLAKTGTALSLVDGPKADRSSGEYVPHQLLALPLVTGQRTVTLDQVGLVAASDRDGDGVLDPVRTTETITVVGFEAVDTLAGSFPKALHIQTDVVNTITGSKDATVFTGRTLAEDWYAPGIGRIKRRVSYGMTSLQVSKGFEAEIVGYKVGEQRSERVAPEAVPGGIGPGSPGPGQDYPLAAGFREPMDPTTMTSSSFQVFDANGNPVAGKVVAYFDLIRFEPLVPLAPGAYRARLTTEIEDMNGNALAAPVEWVHTVSAP